MTLSDEITDHFETDAFAVSALKNRLGFSENSLTYDQGVELVKCLIEPGSLYGPFESSKAYTQTVAESTAYMIKDPDYGDIAEYLDKLTFPITDKYQYEVLLSLADWHHRNKIEMPQVLRDWVDDEFFDPSSPNWPKKKPKDMDLEIVFLVLHLVQSGLKPTENRASGTGTSACDAVAEAMAHFGLRPQSYEGVEAIWGRRKQLFPSCCP